MTKILFGQSYFLRFDPKLWDSMQPYPPLGTLYAASFIRDTGYEVALFDAMLAESEEAWGEKLDCERPDYAVLFEDNFNYLSKMCLGRMREAAFKMISMARERQIPVIVCGADATDHAEVYLARGADFVLLGEGEITLHELLEALVTGGEMALDGIPGLAFQDPDSPAHFIRNPRRPDIKDLDQLPFPAWDLVSVDRYREIWISRHGYFSMNMVTTRGCPYHCNWCAKPIWGQRYNVRSPENVVAELKWLRDQYRPDHIWFADDILGLKPGWLPDFARISEKEGTKIPFKCLSRVDLLLRPGEIQALKDAGAEIVWVGAESGAQSVLSAMEKGTRVEQIYEAREKLEEAGVRVGFFLQFGYPGETRADIEKTLQMVRETMPDDIGMSVSYPLPGTKFYERVESQMGIKQNWYDSSDMAMMYQGPFSTAFYRQLHTVLHKEFRLRKSLEEIRKALRKRTVKDRSLWRGALRLVYHALTLFPARMRLNRLERIPQELRVSINPELTLAEAATPSPPE